MAPGVIDALEMIDIEQEYGYGLCVFSRRMHKLRQARHHIAPIIEPGQWI